MCHNVTCRKEQGTETVLLANASPEDESPRAKYIQPEKSNIVVYWYLTRLQRRIVYEAALLIASLPHLLPKILLLNWGAMMIFRNIAYMRHEQGPRLKDLGFELIPEMDNDFWSEMILYVNGVLSISMVVMPLLSDHAHPRGIYTMNIYMKVLNIQCVGHILRFITFVSTSVPGPSLDCQPGAENYKNTINWHEVFIRRSKVHVDPNCGDLIFSGHMFQVTSFCAVILAEMSKLMPHKVIARIISYLLIATVCIQPYFIVASRNHYSVDVVISTYLAPLVWFAMEGFYRSSFYKKGVICFSQFVPSFVQEFLEVYNPSLLSKKEKDDLDEELQYLVQKYKIGRSDSHFLASKRIEYDIA